MSVQICVALLALLSLSAASDDPVCDELIKTLEDRTKLYGKWILHSGTSDYEDVCEELKTISSSWIKLTPIPDSEDMTLCYGDKMAGKCHFGCVNTTFDGNVTKATFHHNSTSHEHVGRHLVTCPDCVLWSDSSTTDGNKVCRKLYLFTKTGKLDASHLETVKKQAECLNFTLGFHFGETEDLCPEEEAATDVKEEQ